LYWQTQNTNEEKLTCFKELVAHNEENMCLEWAKYVQGLPSMLA